MKSLVQHLPLVLFLGVFLCWTPASQASDETAQAKSEPLLYHDGNAALEGTLYRPGRTARQVPGIVIFHAWYGPTAFEQERAATLAKEGYVVLVADVYGKGVRPANNEEAGAQAGKFKGNRELFRSRVRAALAALKASGGVDRARTAAIGYCFGGTAALELARSGADVKGIFSFHGGLSSPTPLDAKNIRCRVFAYHGAEDSFVPAVEVQAFQEEMGEGNVDYELVIYAKAGHSFTNPQAGDAGIKGLAYNELADKRSWANFMSALPELFGGKEK